MSLYRITTPSATWSISTNTELHLLKHAGKSWPCEVVRATSSRGQTTLVHQFNPAMWIQEPPFERPGFLILDDTGKIVAGAAHLFDALTKAEAKLK